MTRRLLLRAGCLLGATLAFAAAWTARATALPLLPIKLPALLGGPGPVAKTPPVRPDRPPESCKPAPLSGAAPAGRPAFACDFPDPMILRVGRAYYAYGTAAGWQRPGRTFPILRSTDLRRWRPAGAAMASEPSWSAGHLWAPSVLAARGRYFMYYSARRRGDKRHCLAVATAKHPAGPFRDRGPITCGDRQASGYIDPAPLVHRGRAYIFFSTDNPGHSISVLRLDRSLLRARGARRTLLGVDKAWQRAPAFETVEGPWPVRRGKRFYLFYSAGCWCSDYRMGYAVARRPLGPYRDSGVNPVLRGDPGLVAPGGGSLITSRSGRSWLAFHAWTGPPDYDQGGARTLRVSPVSWRGGIPRPLLDRRP